MSSTSAALPTTKPWSLRWWLKGLTKGLIAVALIYPPLLWFQAHYRIAYDMIEGVNCLPYSVFLVDLDDRDVARGDYVAFEARQMEPFYANGTMAIKLAAGVPGDHVTVGREGVAVNGEHWGELVHAEEGGRLWELGRRPADFVRDEQVPARHLWMMATHVRSYDSRYWGYIENDQVIGRAIPLF